MATRLEVDGNFRPDFSGTTRIVKEDHAAIATSFLSRIGLPVSDADRAAAKRWRDLTLHGAARLLVGDPLSALGPSELFQRAISSVDFTSLLGSISSKSLQAAWPLAQSSSARWAGTRDVQNFREHKDIRLSGFASVEPVNDAGEVQHGTLVETYETLQANTRALQFCVTRKMWINDDLNAFARLPQLLADACRRSQDDVSYAQLVSNAGVGPTMTEDGVALFYARSPVANLLTGGGSTLGDTGLTAACKALRLMKGLNGEYRNLTPRFLIVPPSLADTAEALLTARLTLATGITSGTAVLVPNLNQWSTRGLEIVTDARLEAASSTAWYLCADPLQGESLVHVYLKGQREPAIEQFEPSNVLGIGYRVIFDFGCGFSDWRGIVKSAGA